MVEFNFGTRKSDESIFGYVISSLTRLNTREVAEYDITLSSIVHMPVMLEVVFRPTVVNKHTARCGFG